MIERLRKVMGSADQGAAQRAARARRVRHRRRVRVEGRRALLDGAFKLSKRKNEETQLAVGEALAFAFGGVGIEPARVLFGSFTTLEGAAKMHLESLDDLEGMKKTRREADEKISRKRRTGALAPIVGGFRRFRRREAARRRVSGGDGRPVRATHRFATRFSAPSSTRTCTRRVPRSDARRARGCWRSWCTLVGATRLLSMLPEIQEAFGSLLGDQNELTQEMASRGVSVVYELGTEAQRKELLASLMGTFGRAEEAKA